ncbi:MAG TPA: cysteine--tRNA ligase [Candidatus Kaiserbacteria bacterium]|nr:cysteine--tRNA ligase [Candidatus Kaiserbacteria bacterium]
MKWISLLNFRKKKVLPKVVMPILLTNTLSGKKEQFIPLKPGQATMYSCGPTVYSRAHIGNLRPHICADTLSRTLTHAGFRVHRVINITDVGHLTSDADDGEDKVEARAKLDDVTVAQLTKKYTDFFLKDITMLNIDTHHILFPRASEYISEQVSIAKTLEKKGHAYKIDDGLYFDTATFHAYGKLGGIKDAQLSAGARIAVNPQKRNATDFALWKSTPMGVHRLQEWNSPWGCGAPGWHLECSTMAHTLLGTEIDIHTGGMDLIAIHHNNEIAQSESAFDRPFAHYWIHNAFLTMAGNKISKSLHNEVYLDDLPKRNIHPLALRYLFHQTHYRTPISFSWEALSGAHDALVRLWRLSHEIKNNSFGNVTSGEYRYRLISAVRNDLNTAQALAILWEALRDENITPEEKAGVLIEADALLGIDCATPPLEYKSIPDHELPDEIRSIRDQRDRDREEKKYERADTLRDALQRHGYRVEDGLEATLLYKDRK